MRSKFAAIPACFLAPAQPINVPSHYVFLLITSEAAQRQAHGGDRRRSGAEGRRFHSQP
jgi:hypothetical protein